MAEPCVTAILCTLSNATLTALGTIIDTQIVAAQTQITALEARLLVYDVATLPLQAVAAAGQAILDQARSVATLVPLGLIADCTDLGDFNVNLVQTIDQVNAEVIDTVDDLNRLLSFSEELAFVIEELNGIIDQFNDIKLSLAECSGGSGA